MNNQSFPDRFKTNQLSHVEYIYVLITSHHKMAELKRGSNLLCPTFYLRQRKSHSLDVLKIILKGHLLVMDMTTSILYKSVHELMYVDIVNISHLH